MADEREGREDHGGASKRAANEDNIQTGGRKDNAAQPLNASDNTAGAERYPPSRRDDAVEPRSFSGEAPKQGAGDGGPESTQQGRLGPEGDPAEGKR